MNDPWSIRRARRWFAWLTGRDVGLDLSGLRVYTEAATGPYRMTAALALAAGAEAVHAMSRSSRYGPASVSLDQTREFVSAMGLDASRLSVSEGHEPEMLARADLVTNMGMLRPIVPAIIEKMRPGAVISLMYEPWELREEDLDLIAAADRGVWVIGVCEHNHVIRCYGAAAVISLRGLLSLDIGVFNSSVLVLCRNRFVNQIVTGLAPLVEHLSIVDSGAFEGVLPVNATRIDQGAHNSRIYEAVIVFDLPEVGRWSLADGPAIFPRPCLGEFDAMVQAMGDVRRSDFPGVRFVPLEEPPRGYMGLNPAELGPDLVLSVVGAGLRAGQEACHMLKAFGSHRPSDPELAGNPWILPVPEPSQSKAGQNDE